MEEGEAIYSSGIIEEVQWMGIHVKLKIAMFEFNCVKYQVKKPRNCHDGLWSREESDALCRLPKIAQSVYFTQRAEDWKESVEQIGRFLMQAKNILSDNDEVRLVLTYKTCTLALFHGDKCLIKERVKATYLTSLGLSQMLESKRIHDEICFEFVSKKENDEIFACNFCLK